MYFPNHSKRKEKMNEPTIGIYDYYRLPTHAKTFGHFYVIYLCVGFSLGNSERWVEKEWDRKREGGQEIRREKDNE